MVGEREREREEEREKECLGEALAEAAADDYSPADEGQISLAMLTECD